MTEQESIELIKKMIHRSKANLKEQSPYYLLWGWLVLIAAVLNYLFLEIMQVENHYLVWPIAVAVGVVGSIVLGFRQGKGNQTKTFIDRAMTFLWSGWLAFFFILLLWSGYSGTSWGKVYTLAIALYGLGTFASGGIIRFKPLIYGGIASFVIAILCILLGIDQTFSYMLIALALSIIVSYLIPGYLLRKSE